MYFPYTFCNRTQNENILYFEVKHYVNNFVLNVPELKSLDFAPPHPNTLNESNAK